MQHWVTDDNICEALRPDGAWQAAAKACLRLLQAAPLPKGPELCEQAAKGIKIPFDDLSIGASELEQNYAVATLNVRHFGRIPNLIITQI